MVIAPLLVVKVNWACTTAGSAKSSTSGSSLVAQAVLKRPASVFGQVVFTMEVFVFMVLLMKLFAQHFRFTPSLKIAKTFLVK
jgi:hypothetical protein